MNKKRFTLFLVVVAAILVAVVIFICNRDKKIKLGEDILLKANQTVKVEDAGEKVKLSLKSDLKPKEDSSDIVVKYELSVGKKKYNGEYKFYPEYETSKSDNNMPYNVEIIKVENEQAEVVITKK